MFEVRKHEEKPIVIIRTATPQELANYEKWKLRKIKDDIQVNELEIIRVETTSKKEAFISIENKTANERVLCSSADEH